MKKLKAILIVLIILGIIVFGIIKVVKSKVDAVSEIQEGNADNFFASYTVKKQDVSSYVRGSGTITSFNIETLEIEAGNRVSEILVSEGQKVNAKQEILKVVNDEGKTKTIKSSISGMFFCIEDQTMGTKYCIYNLDDIGIKMALAEKDITSVNVNQKVKIKITALDKEFEGNVSYVSSLPQNDKFLVRIKLNYNDDIKFGYSATASILTSEKTNAIVIPYDYVKMNDDGRYFVYKEDRKNDLYNTFWDNTEKPEEWKTYIEVGTITSNDVEVISGLEEGEKIISSVW